MSRSASSLRRELVDQLEKQRVLKSARVRRAFEQVPREVFIPEIVAERGLEAVYRDEVYVTKKDAAGSPISSSSQPGIMAAMLEMLEVSRDQHILEIGAGTGYNAALLGKLVGAGGRITTVDIDPDLCRRARRALKQSGATVRVVAGDGHAGHPAGAPYDRIIVTASTPHIPRAWFEQLAPGGRLVVPLRLKQGALWQKVVAFRKEGHEFVSGPITSAGFMGLRTTADAAAADIGLEHVVSIAERHIGNLHLHAYVTGQPLGRMTSAGRKRLLDALSRKRRSQRLAGKSAWMALNTIGIFTIPSSRLVSFNRTGAAGIGAVDKHGTGLSIIVTSKGNVSYERYGSMGRADPIRETIREWERLGSPKASDLIMRLSFAGPRRRAAWRRFTLGEAEASIEWRT